MRLTEARQRRDHLRSSRALDKAREPVACDMRSSSPSSRDRSSESSVPRGQCKSNVLRLLLRFSTTVVRTVCPDRQAST